MNPIQLSATKQVFNGKSYYLCGKYFQNNGERLHRTVYEFHNGPIPKGMAVHHIDEDRSNNRPENLALMAIGEHTTHHHTGLTCQMPVEAINAAAEWHGSREGVEWHKAQYQRTKHKLHIKKVITCLMCRKEVEVTDTGVNKFCSAKCGTKYRKISGVDDELRVCEYCAGRFTVNKYKSNRFCCRGCSSKANAKKRA